MWLWEADACAGTGALASALGDDRGFSLASLPLSGGAPLTATGRSSCSHLVGMWLLVGSISPPRTTSFRGGGEDGLRGSNGLGAKGQKGERMLDMLAQMVAEDEDDTEASVL